ATHPTGDATNQDMHLNLFVFFASIRFADCLLKPFRGFRGQQLFLGLTVKTVSVFSKLETCFVGFRLPLS
ncbi:MAG: hypothetical protein Q7U78_08670, partial [Gallionella sp.]|nr:hypothetical protein [Gallionella sp.]